MYFDAGPWASYIYNLSEPHFTQLGNGNNNVYVKGCCEDLKKMMFIKLPAHNRYSANVCSFFSPYSNKSSTV